MVSVVTTLWPRWSVLHILVGARDFWCFQNQPDLLWDQHILLLSRYQGSLAGVKWLRQEVYHSSTSVAKVKNKCICTSSPSICVHVVVRSSLIFCGVQKRFLLRISVFVSVLIEEV